MHRMKKKPYWKNRFLNIILQFQAFLTTKIRPIMTNLLYLQIFQIGDRSNLDKWKADPPEKFPARKPQYHHPEDYVF